MKNFWKSLSKPIFILSPMDDVTDTVFRRIVMSCSKPDAFFTEFVNCEGILHQAPQVLQKLKYSEIERPIVAQIWGKVPKSYFKVAQILKEMGFDGIDINMGCPESGIVKKGCCSALINNHKLTGEIIQATKDGAGGLPVSVKTRLGFRTLQTEEWVKFLLEQNIDALTLHGRTTSEMSKVPAHWDEIAKAVQIRNELGKSTLILGNGDISSSQDALDKIKEYKVDGVMIGRGVFKDLWIFDKSGNKYQPTLKEKLKLLIKHAELYDKVWGNTRHFVILRKFFKSYVNDFENASDLRIKLVQTNSLEEVKELLIPYLKLNPKT